MKPSLSKHISNLIIGLCFCQILFAETKSLDSIDVYLYQPGDSISIIIPAEPKSITAKSKIVLGPSNQILSASTLYQITNGRFGVTLKLKERIKQIGPVRYDIVDDKDEPIATGTLILKGKTAEVERIIIENGSEDLITLSEGRITYSMITLIGRNFYLNTEIEFDNDLINVVGSPSVLFASDSDINQIDTFSFAIVIRHKNDKKKKIEIGNHYFSIINRHATVARDHLLIEKFKAEGGGYVQVSTIKSISGIAPPSEFIDAQFYRHGKSFSSLSSLDIPFSVDEDTSKNKGINILNEATLFFAWKFGYTYRLSHKIRPMRASHFGLLIKLFDGDVYYGLALGGIELEESLLFGSYLLGGFVWDINKRFEYNFPSLYMELRIHSAGAPFFKTFAVKVGVFISKPWSKEEVSMKSRIILEVPIGVISSI